MCHFNCYVDYLQNCLPSNPNDSDALYSLSGCTDYIKLWLSLNFPHLNDDKSECINFDSNCVSDVNLSSCGALASFVKPALRNLDVIFDSTLKFDKEIV